MNTMAILAWTIFDPMHMLVIGVIALLLFGKRLPEVGRSLGRGISEFKKGLKDVGEELNKDDDDRAGSSGRLNAPRDAAAHDSAKETVEAERRDR